LETILINICDVKIRENWNIRQSVIKADINSLKASILMTGLRHPITINNAFELVSGHRRLQACKDLGWDKVPAVKTEFDTEMHERLAHIDENIEAKSLNDKDFEKALAERRRIYELLHPQSTKRGPKDDEEHKSFATDTAEKTGISEDKIRKLTKRVEGASEEVRASYEADDITSSQIDEIVKLPVDEQNRILDKIKGASIAETKMIVKDYVNAKRNKEELKKSKKEKEHAPQVEDKRLLEAIITSQRVVRACTEAEIMLNELLLGSKYEHLDKTYIDNIKVTLNNLHEKLAVVIEKIGA